MRNVATGQCSYRDNGNGTATRELHSLLIDLSQIRIKRTRHRVLRRNLVHTVGYDSQGIGIRSHIGQQHQYLFIIVHSEIFCRRQCHVRNQQTFYRRILRCIHEADDTVERTGIGEHILKVQVVIIRHTHTTQNNLICLGTKCYIRHYLVKRLVGVRKEWNFLSGYQRIVQVDTCNTCCNQFRRLFTTYRVHRRATDLHFLAFDGRTSVNRITESVEETPCKLFAHFQRRRLAQEYYLRIGGDTFRTLEYLQSHIVTGNLHHLGELAVYGSQLVIPYPCCFQRAGSFRNLSDLGIYFLKCFCCHLILFYALRSSISSCNCLRNPSYSSDLNFE